MGKIRKKNKILLKYIIISIIIILPIFLTLDSTYKKELIETEREKISEEVRLKIKSMEMDLSQRTTLLEAITAFASIEKNKENIDKNRIATDFDKFAGVLYNTTPGIRNFAIAPGGIQGYVYPLKGNEIVLGHNLLNDSREDVKKNMQEAIELKDMVFRGPYELRQGGLGLIMTNPIFDDNEIWGFTSMAIEMIPIIEKAELNNIKENHIQVAIKNKYGVFYGDSSVFENPNSISEEISVLNTKWAFAAISLNQYDKSNLNIFRAIFFISALLALFLVYFIIEK